MDIDELESTSNIDWDIHDDMITQFDGTHLTVWMIKNQQIRCNWDTLQKIKNDVCGVDATLIEIYPANEDVVNETNKRHFWLVDPETVSKFNLKRR